MGPNPSLALTSEGFAVVEGVLARHECQQLAASAAQMVAATAGSRRLMTASWCQSLAAKLRADPRLQEVLPANYVATQCTYFSKCASRNWLVPIHQDLSIPVAEKVSAPGLRGWSEKVFSGPLPPMLPPKHVARDGASPAY